MLGLVLCLLCGFYAAVGIITAVRVRAGRVDVCPAPAELPVDVCPAPAELPVDVCPAPAELPFVSVLIAARNERDALPGCLDALRRQAYPRTRFEVIVADDHSTDETHAVAEALGARVVRVPNGRRGKAHALHAAIMTARGDVLAITDADCRPPSHWIRELSGQVMADGTGIVCGMTFVTGASLLARIQAFDWKLLLTVASALSEMGMPVTGMGNNMALRRAAYEDVGGYPALPDSVTEDYALFRAVAAQPSWRVRLLPDARFHNVTLPVPRLRDVINQRKRWARGGLRASPWLLLFYAIIFAVHVSIVVGLFIVPAAAASALVAKIGADYLVLRSGISVVEESPVWTSLLVFELYFFGYVLSLPFLLLLRPRVEWRGRTW